MVYFQYFLHHVDRLNIFYQRKGILLYQYSWRYQMIQDTAIGPQCISLPTWIQASRHNENKALSILKRNLYLADLQTNYMQKNLLNKLPSTVCSVFCKFSVSVPPSSSPFIVYVACADSWFFLPFLPASQSFAHYLKVRDHSFELKRFHWVRKDCFVLLTFIILSLTWEIKNLIL